MYDEEFRDFIQEFIKVEFLTKSFLISTFTVFDEGGISRTNDYDDSYFTVAPSPEIKSCKLLTFTTRILFSFSVLNPVKLSAMLDFIPVCSYLSSFLTHSRYSSLNLGWGSCISDVSLTSSNGLSR